MSEIVKLKGNFFGYDRVLRTPDLIIELQGDDVPSLALGMKVVLTGDSEGYVAPGFHHGEEAAITAFREPWVKGASDDLICVTNGRQTGWIKPSRIQKSVSSTEPRDPVYRKVRKQVHRSFADFLDAVYVDLPTDQRNRLPSETYDFVCALVRYALESLPRFGEQLAEAIASVYRESPHGERFVTDPINASEASGAILFLDPDGHIVSVKNPVIVWSISQPRNLEMQGYESYRVLTGPNKGQRFYSDTRPLGDPVYVAGAVARSFAADDTRDPVVSAAVSDASTHASAPLERTRDHPARTSVFISYSHQDKRWLDRLQIHLKPLERLGKINRWDDTLIKPGSKWREEIRAAIASAKVAVLLVSADFLASDFIAKDELPPLLMAAESEGATILPVIVSHCRFTETKSLAQFQSVNPPARPLASMPKSAREAALVKLVAAIEGALHNV